MFLHRYSEPVLLVLHEVAPTWTGNLRERKDTMAVTALSVNVVHKRLTLLWSARDLPSDAARLSAVPLGGALVLCRSLIRYVSQVRAPLMHAPAHPFRGLLQAQSLAWGSAFVGLCPSPRL